MEKLYLIDGKVRPRMYNGKLAIATDEELREEVEREISDLLNDIYGNQNSKRIN